ncbi:MAG: hypothetical protein KAT04_14135 [Methylococcales bacterium]|nr:hypothetical protein [Methylococcales bacterium]
MKLNYFGYSIENETNHKKHLMDIRPFLNAFCSYGNTGYKNTFSHNGEQIFLLKSSKNLYLFLMKARGQVFDL